MGCGGNDLTGGSVPIGNPTRLVGVVVDEADPNTPLADAEVEIILEDGRKITTKTDTSGMFVVEIPRSKRFTLRVRPPGGFGLLYQEWTDTFVADADEIRVVIPILRTGMMLAAFTELRVYPEEVTLRVHERVRFQIHLQPSPQRPIRPIWSVHGGVGVITHDGLFIATRVGKGFVRVRVGNLHAEAKVIVQAD